jgi:hypothetical protein
MRALLLGLAVSFATALPTAAEAIDTDHPAFVGNSSVTIHSGMTGSRDRNFRRHRNGDGSVLIYDRDYQGDSMWRSDSFNDWWHDNPSRAYPHWMLGNQNCERQWYQGNVLRC